MQQVTVVQSDKYRFVLYRKCFAAGTKGIKLLLTIPVRHCFL